MEIKFSLDVIAQQLRADKPPYGETWPAWLTPAKREAMAATSGLMVLYLQEMERRAAKAPKQKRRP